MVTGRPQRLTRFEQFDAASRGPLGGLELFVSLRLKHFAALGAFATVTFLAFDPFLQSMISYQGQLGPATASGSSVNKLLRLDIGKATFDSDLWVRALSGSDYWIGQHPWAANEPDLGLSMAFMEGFANTSQSKPTVSAACESGNCTWPTYHSLDICGACTGVSSHIARKRRLNLNNPDLMWEYEQIDGDSLEGDCINQMNSADDCFVLSSDDKTVTDGYNNTYSTNPDHTPVSYNISYQLASVGFTNQESAFLNASKDQVIVVNATSEPLETINFQNMTTLLAAFTILKAPDSYLRRESTWNETSPTADECALYICINEYNVEMVNGAVQQVVKPTSFRRNPASLGNSTNPAFVNESIFLTDGLPPIADPYRLYNVSAAAQAVTSWFSDPALWHPEGNIFGQSLGEMDLQLIFESQNSTQETFNISANTVFSTIQYILSWTVDHTLVDFFYSDIESAPDFRSNNFVWRTANETGNSFVDMLYQSTNISATFENAVRHMSSYIQNIDTASQAQRAAVVGTSQVWGTHIKIQWPYITLPALTLLVGYIYVILALWQTRRLGVRPWKESTVPMLSHGLNEEAQQLLRDAESGDCLDAVEKMAWLRFEGGPNGRMELGSGARVWNT